MHRTIRPQLVKLHNEGEANVVRVRQQSHFQYTVRRHHFSTRYAGSQTFRPDVAGEYNVHQSAHIKKLSFHAQRRSKV